MAKKFLIVVAGIVAIMAALIVLPVLFSQGDDLSIEYTRDSVIRTEDGAYVIGEREILGIRGDGSATYSRMESSGQPLRERSLTVGSNELKGLRELFLGTGFMDIPATGYIEKAGLANFTRYHLLVKSVDDSQSIRWVNAEAIDETVPSIITNAGSRLDGVIKRHS